MSLILVNEMEKNVIDGTTYESSQIEKFSINSMKGSLEKVALARVFRVEKFEQLQVSCILHHKAYL